MKKKWNKTIYNRFLQNAHYVCQRIARGRIPRQYIIMKFTGVKGDQCAVLTPPGETRVVKEGTAIYLQT